MDLGLANGIYSNKLEGNATGLYDSIRTGLHNGLYYNNDIGIPKNGLILNLDASNSGSYLPPYNSTTWFDMSGNAYNGTLTSGPIFDRENGGNILFDGIDDYVGGTGIDNASSALGGSFGVSISMWLKRSVVSAGTARTFLGLANSSATHKILLQFNSTDKLLVFGRTTTESSSSVTSVNSFTSTILWYNVIAIYNYSANRILSYVNGIQQTTTGTVNFSQSTLGLGTNNTINRIGSEIFSATIFPGNIASVLFYNRAITTPEVIQIYKATKSRFNL